MSGPGERPRPPSPSVPPTQIREARLRPEFAALYPWIQADVWYLAASVERPTEGEDIKQSRGRHRLSDTHFEFRGGESRPRAPARWRSPVRDATRGQ